MIEELGNRTDLLREFLEGAGESLSSFRYFKKRDFSCLRGHLVTYLCLEDGSPVSYGHLDREGDKVWLGVCVKWGSRGAGHGRDMMNALLSFAKRNDISKISLSVDAKNERAVRLYESYGFKITRAGDPVLYELDRRHQDG